MADLIKKIMLSTDDAVEAVLGEISSWTWPRSDLGAWIDPLDKFDSILDVLVTKYDLEALQIQPFSPEDKTQLLSVLRFLRLLLENTTNRKVFSSYDVRVSAFVSQFLP